MTKHIDRRIRFLSPQERTIGAAVGQEVVTETYGLIEVTDVDASLQIHCRSVNDPDQGDLVFDMESWQEVLQEARVCAEAPEKCKHCKKDDESENSDSDADASEPAEVEEDEAEEPVEVEEATEIEEDQASGKKARKKGGE